MQAGSLVPVWANSTIDHYIYVDSTGAEYSLNQNNGNVWTSQEGVYISYNANTNILHSTDGTFWAMGCQSAGGEPDSGTLYPTTFEDTNGNQINVHYLTGSGSSQPNTSARIYYIEDQRSGDPIPGTHSSYSFTYDGTNHLSSFTNQIWDNEGYTFTFQSSGTLVSPLNSNDTFPAEYLLTSAKVTYYGAAHTFSYSSGSAEMTSWTSMYGGTLSWTYRSFTYTGNVSMREVLTRSMQSLPWNSSYSSFNLTNTWMFYHDDSYDETLDCHYYTQLNDEGAGTWKMWVFNVAEPAIADANQYWEYVAETDPLITKMYTWSQGNGNTYVSSVATSLNPGFSYGVTTTSNQTLDAHGNLTQQTVYDYGNSSSPAWTYNMTYLSDSNHTSLNILNRVLQATVTTPSAGTIYLANNSYDAVYNCDGVAPPAISPILHDSNYGTNFVYRGNLTGSQGLNFTDPMCYAYNINGVLYATMDGANRLATASTSSSTNYSLPSAITPNNNANLTTSFGYSSTFDPASFTGPNGEAASTIYDGIFGFPLSSTLVDGASITYSYAWYQSGNSQSINSQTATLGNQWKETILDGFGRTVRVITGYTVNGSGTTVNTVDSQYAACACSPLGKLKQTSLPYAPGGTPAWTVYTYDASGRTLTAVKPDGASTTTYSYQGNNTTVTDPAGKWKTFTSDASGNLTAVTEPNTGSNCSGNCATDYTYDGASHLLGVSMPRSTGTQTRSFTWYGSHLASSTNPENGTVTYQYDGSGRVNQRVDAKGQKTVYTYDVYGRLTEVQHFNSSGTEDPAQRVTYHYDYNSNPVNSGFTQYGWGRLTGVTFQNDSFNQEPLAYYYSYNKAGRVIDQQLQLDFIGYQTQGNGQPLQLDALYAWDNQGRMTSLVDPGTPLPATAFQYQYDNVSRLTTMLQTTCTGLSQPGSLWHLGSSSTIASASYNAAGEITSMSYDMFSETRTYNTLLQLTQETASGAWYFNNQYVNLTAKNMSYVYSVAQNNGKILQSTDNVTGETVNYTYDALNRLIGAQATAGGWGETYTYDGFGNMGSGFSAATNRTSTQSADANGNSTASGYTWDMENRLLSAVSGTFWAYDPHGKRVFTEVSGSNTTCEVDFYGIGGRKLAAIPCQYDTNGVFSTGTPLYNVYFGRKLIRSKNVTVVTDRLGSVRGTSNDEVMRYTPYGTERTSTADGREKWGTYIRDAGTGNDYADQRYKGVGMAEFLSPDPGGIMTARPRNPGSWNRYMYVLGDPMNLNDPRGKIACDPGDDDADDDCDDSDSSDGGGGGGGTFVTSTVQAVCAPGYIPDANGDGGCDQEVWGSNGGNGGAIIGATGQLLSAPSYGVFIYGGPQSSTQAIGEANGTVSLDSNEGFSASGWFALNVQWGSTTVGAEFPAGIGIGAETNTDASTDPLIQGFVGPFGGFIGPFQRTLRFVRWVHCTRQWAYRPNWSRTWIVPQPQRRRAGPSGSAYEFTEDYGMPRLGLSDV